MVNNESKLKYYLRFVCGLYFSPQRDMEEDGSRNRTEEAASSSTTDTEKSRRAMENSLDSTDGHKLPVENSDSMDIDDQSQEAPEIGQAGNGEPVSSTVPPTETGAPDTTAILSVMEEIYQVIRGF
jgi:hypothetical protein